MCIEFTFYDHYNLERVLEWNHVRDFNTIVLSRFDDIAENKNVWSLGVIDDTSPLVIDGTVQNIVHEINKLRVGCLQLLCLENLYKADSVKGDKMLITMDGKKFWL